MGQKQGKEDPPPLPNPGETCKDFVARICGTNYEFIVPWVSNLAGWTEAIHSVDPFPRDGANDEFHIDMIKGLCLGDKRAFPWYPGDPQWDMDYMEKGGENWLKYAPYWFQRDNKKQKKPTKCLSKEDYDQKHREEADKKRFVPDPIAPPLPIVSHPPPAYVHVYPSLRKEDIDLLAGHYATRQRQVPPAPQPQQQMPPAPQQDRQHPQRARVEVGEPEDDQGAIGGVVSPPGQEQEEEDVKGDRILSPPKTKSGTVYSNTNLQTPFMTIGNELLKKVIDIEDIDRIVKHCPKPTASAGGTLTYLKKACKGRNYTQEDMRLIIDGIIGHTSSWSWANVPSINTIDTGNAGAYGLNTVPGRDAMWTELETEMMRVFKNKSSLPTAIACKQKSGETVVEFWKRFHENWTTEAGLATTTDVGALFIQTFMNNLKPQFALVVKQMISEWTTQTIDQFQETLIQKEAAGCFDVIKEKAVSSLYQGGVRTQPPQDNGGQWGSGNRGRGRGRTRGRGHGFSRPPQQSRTCCFNCGQQGHWRNQCPYEWNNPNTQDQDQMRTQGPQSSQPNQVAPKQQGPRFPIQWNQQQLK